MSIRVSPNARESKACNLSADKLSFSQARNAFCAIRPPGHHAGPLGTVPSALDPHGSQGFCFLNNIAIAGAYAMNAYRHQGENNTIAAVVRGIHDVLKTFPAAASDLIAFHTQLILSINT